MLSKNPVVIEVLAARVGSAQFHVPRVRGNWPTPEVAAIDASTQVPGRAVALAIGSPWS